MSDPRVVEQPDGTVIPAPGYEWCGYCNGEGVIVTMDSGPHLDERTTDCGFCDGGIRGTYAYQRAPDIGSSAAVADGGGAITT